MSPGDAQRLSRLRRMKTVALSLLGLAAVVYTHNTEHVFGLTVAAGTPVVLNPREHLQYRWLPWREAADRCFSPSNAEAVLMLPRFLDLR